MRLDLPNEQMSEGERTPTCGTQTIFCVTTGSVTRTMASRMTKVACKSEPMLVIMARWRAMSNHTDMIYMKIYIIVEQCTTDSSHTE